MLPMDRLEEFLERLRFLQHQRRRWAQVNQISCYRLFEEDVFPLIIDVYEKDMVCYVLEEPADEQDLTQVVQLVQETLGWSADRIYLKRRHRQKEGVRYERLNQTDQLVTVREGGLKFFVNLHDYLDTGLFLDHRWTRSYVRSLSAGRRVLNLFAYTGSFTVYAAQGGAFETATVDLNANYGDWAKKNLTLNGLEGPGHRFYRRDVFEFLKSETRKQWDLIILDPPTFSQSKKMEGTLDVQRDYPRLIQGCLKILSPDGILVFSNNYQKFKFDERLFPKIRCQEISSLTVPRDFHKGVHRCWLLTREMSPELTLPLLDKGVG